MSNKRPPLLQFASPWSFDPGVVHLLEPRGNVSHDEAFRRLSKGEQMRPFILETPSERRLHFTHDAVQSAMRLDAPHRLVTAYTRKMMAFLLFAPEPADIVMIGLGGGSIPKFCHRHLRKTQITVVEIDRDVISLREEFCVPHDDERFRIVHDDGAYFISEMNDPVDVIIVDAFDAVGIAPSLAAPDFYVQALRHLRPDGVLVMNLSGEHTRHVAHLKRIHSVFEDRTLLLPVGDENLLLFAFKTELPRILSPDLDAHAKQLQQRLRLQFPQYLRRIREEYGVA